MKAKPTTTQPTGATRPEQPRNDSTPAGVGMIAPVVTMIDPMRTQAAPISPTSSTIRYPVQLPHFPLQSPTHPYPFISATGPIPYNMPYVMHPIIQPTWNGMGYTQENFVSFMNHLKYGKIVYAACVESLLHINLILNCHVPLEACFTSSVVDFRRLRLSLEGMGTRRCSRILSS